MHRIVIKICFVFLLMMMSLTNSAVAIKTQEELLDSLDLEKSKVVLCILHELRENRKPNLLTKFSDTPDGVAKAQNILNVLSLFLNKKVKKIDTVRFQFQRELQDEKLLAYRDFLNEWEADKKWKNEQSQPSLEKNFNEAITSEIISGFEFVKESDSDEELSEFVMLGEEREVATLHPQSSLVAGSSTDMSPTIVSLPSTLRQIKHDDFLEVLDLDKKSAKIIVKSILNGYCIPTKEFDLKRKTDQDRYGKVTAYLLWILHNKEEKVLGQKAALVPDQPRSRFDSDWYDSKLKKYENYRKAITSPNIPSGKSFFANFFRRFSRGAPASD